MNFINQADDQIKDEVEQNEGQDDEEYYVEDFIYGNNPDDYQILQDDPRQS